MKDSGFFDEKFSKPYTTRPFYLPSKAFTLIELLVVIAIISMLMGVLMPALSMARKKAYSVVCISNLRHLAFTGQTYLADGDGSFPPFRMTKARPADTQNYVNKFGREQPRWQWFFHHGIGPVIDPEPYIKFPGDTFGDADTLIMTNDYFVCPAFVGSSFDLRDERNGSYGFNYQYLGNSRIRNGSFENFPVYVEKIRRPAERVFLADSRGARGPDGPSDIQHGLHSYTLDPPKIARSYNAVNFAFHTQPQHWMQHSPAEARHNGEANVAFVDGHVQSLSLDKIGYVLDEKGSVIAGQGDNSHFSSSGRDEK